MKIINIYINEKLKINKDSKLNNKYILFYRFDRTDRGYKITNSLEGMMNFMDTMHGKLGSHYVFYGEADSIENLELKIKNFPIWHRIDIQKIRDFCKTNDIKELTANDINNARINAKNK